MDVIFHIGLVKTASTFLQRRFFRELPNKVLYVGPVDHWPQHDDLLKEHRCLLISNENFSGNPLKCESRGLSYFEQFEKSVNTLNELFTNVKVIVGFREPSSFIESIYKQYLHEWGTRSWEEFIEHFQVNLVEGLYFSEYVNLLQRKFSSEQLFIYTLEELKQNQDETLMDLANFLEVPFVQNNEAHRRKPNKSVLERFEPTLIALNKTSAVWSKVFGFRLGLRLGSFVLNPSKLCRDILPRIFADGPSSRNLADLSAKYEQDWAETCEKISKIRIERHFARKAFMSAVDSGKAI